VVQDIVSGVEDSRTINKSEQIEAYVEKLEKPEMMGRGRPLTVHAFKLAPRAPRVRQPTTLIPKSVLCTINAPAVRRMLVELQNLNYSKFPNAAHDLLRSFLECSLKAYFVHVGITVKPARGHYVQLADVLKEGLSHFPTKNRSLVQPIQVLMASAGSSTKDYLVSLDHLNAINHNPHVTSSREHVEEAWTQMAGIITYVLNPK
jgi:hypothetical protein